MSLKDRHVLMWFERRVNATVNVAVREALRQQRRKLLPDEENVTAFTAGEINRQLADGLQRRLGNRRFRGVSVDVKVYQKQTEEPLLGADLGVAIRMTANSSKTEKGVLIQAKLISNDDYSKLKEQCGDMLKITPDSFVMVYDPQRSTARVYSAHSISAEGGNHRRAAGRCYSETFGGLIRQMIRTFVGDHRIAPQIRDAAELAELPVMFAALSRAVLIDISRTSRA